MNGAKYLADALKINTSITMVDLWDNNIGDNGAKYLADALKTNKSITSIDLRTEQDWR
jgi:Ran GTPase-activating protein (RanGAP) involved in mRNA processing and transport